MGKMKLKNPMNKSRRDFMKNMGLAAGLAAPFLNSSVAMGQTTTAPVRVLLIPLQHGWGFDQNIQPFSGTETNFIIPTVLKALNPIKQHCVFVDSLHTSWWGNAHDVNYSEMFTCSQRIDDPAASALGGPFPAARSASLDWMIGNHVNKPVLRLSHNYKSWGAAFHPLCFDASLRNLPFYTNSRDAYMGIIDPLKQMQQPLSPGKTAANKSLFDMLGKDTNRLLNRLTGTQNTKMQGYLNALNSLGTRIMNPNQGPSNIILPPLPGLTESFNNQLDQYLEMIRIAFTLDTHRVAVLGLGEGVTDFQWTDTEPAGTARVGNIFGSDFHHEIAHYNELPRPRAAFEGWVNWYAQKIAAFVQVLQNTTDVDGRPLLDNTIIVLNGEVGNGNHDTHNFMHTVIGGGGAGRIRRGRWLKLAKFEPRDRKGVFHGSRLPDGTLKESGFNYGPPISVQHASDLWVSVARLAGLNINTFGIDVYNTTPIAL